MGDLLLLFPGVLLGHSALGLAFFSFEEEKRSGGTDGKLALSLWVGLPFEVGPAARVF